ncbi:MAG: periplasmic heavy metal sensor [Sandarakinorhabdus sp.]|nr:periplasmic heavy metal sensor [Sandarakinorhabdus sp.]
MTGRRRTLLIALIAFVAAIAGVWIGRVVLAPKPAADSELHALLHDQLNLDPAQHAKLDALEAQFAVRRKALEFEMRADNARLAAAIEVEHGYGPKVSSAIDQSHMAMGELQKETLEHVFAMRELLRPDQTAKFDEAVVKALTADQK